MFNKQPNHLISKKKKNLTTSNKNGGYDCTEDEARFDWWEGVVACGGLDLFGSEVFGLYFFGSEFGSEVFGSDDSDFSGLEVFGSHTSHKYIPVKVKWLRASTTGF